MYACTCELHALLEYLGVYNKHTRYYMLLIATVCLFVLVGLVGDTSSHLSVVINEPTF